MGETRSRDARRSTVSRSCGSRCQALAVRDNSKFLTVATVPWVRIIPIQRLAATNWGPIRPARMEFFYKPRVEMLVLRRLDALSHIWRS